VITFWRLFVVAGLMAIVTASAAQPREVRGDAKVPCQFTESDLVCLVKPVLGLKPGPKRVRKPKVRLLQPGSTVDVKGKKGNARVFFGREGECRLLARGDRTTIITRRPQDFLFTQQRGETRCTISGKVKVATPRKQIPARASSAQAPKFAAILLELRDQDEPIQYRVRLRPRSSVGIAVRRGDLLVALSTGQVRDVGQGEELRAGLTRGNTIKPGSLRVEEAHFTAAEERSWTEQARSWFSLSVEIAGSGSGSVVSDPVGINCGDDCQESYASGALVSLTAKPATGSQFVAWRGPCEGASARCVVTMKAARSVTAVFTKRLLLSLRKEGSGSGTVTSNPAGISCGSRCQAQYDAGTFVTLTASAAGGSAFAGWSGACAGTASPCYVTMDEAKAVTATFVPGLPGAFVLHVDRQGSGSGTVTSNPPDINCGSACEASYASGTDVQLTATPAGGSSFAGWSGACSGTASSCSVTMDAAKSVTATFLPAYVLRVDKQGSGGGKITSSPAGIDCGSVCEAHFNPGTSVTVTAHPATTSRFDSWSSGPCGATENPCFLTMNAAKSLTAVFVQQFGLTIQNPGGGSVSVDPGDVSCSSNCGPIIYDAGTPLTLTATPDEGMIFAGWGGDGGCSGTGTCAMTMDRDKTVTAAFTTPPPPPPVPPPLP
jgi:hypothetical protein